MKRVCTAVGVLVLLAYAFEIARFVDAAKSAKPTQSTRPTGTRRKSLEKLKAADTDLFSAATTCKNILKNKPNSPSGTYTVTTSSGDFISIYCEMGLNGGGYTFLSPMSLVSLTDAEIQTMFTDRTTFLLRVRKTNGTQPYAVLSQLSPKYSSIPLTLSLSTHVGFSPPFNNIAGALEPPFLFYGFVPNANYSLNGTMGLTVNGVKINHTNCDEKRYSHFALYTNFKEAQPQRYTYPDNEFLALLFSRLLPNPSGRVIPTEFFFFGEVAFGGCGTYKQTNKLPDITGFTIGFR